MQTDLTRIADELNAASAELAAATATLDRYADTINVNGLFTAEQVKDAIESIRARCLAIDMSDIAVNLNAAHMVAESIQLADEEAAEARMAQRRIEQEEANRADEERRDIEFNLRARAEGRIYNGDLLRSLY